MPDLPRNRPNQALASPPRLWEVFWNAAGHAEVLRPLDSDRVEEVLRQAITDSQTQWPGLELDAASFVAYLGERLARDPQVLEQVAVGLSQGTFPSFVEVPDLYLACGCATACGQAIASFERHFGTILSTLAARFAKPHQPAEDLGQSLREKLFVRQEMRPPRIAEYRGVGHLENWLRVTASRSFMDELRRAKRAARERPSSDEELLDITTAQSWELSFLKEHYRDAFRQTFAEALGHLPTEDRILLRFHTLSGLSIDQLAGLYKIHRSNVARRLARIRECLLEQTRAGLMERLRVDRREFESIMTLISSRLDVSLGRLLTTATGLGPAPEEP